MTDMREEGDGAVLEPAYRKVTDPQLSLLVLFVR